MNNYVILFFTILGKTDCFKPRYHDNIINSAKKRTEYDDFFNDYKELYLTLKKEIDNLRKKDKKISKDFEKNKINSENFAKKTLGQIVFLFFLQKKGWLGIERNENNNDANYFC